MCVTITMRKRGPQAMILRGRDKQEGLEREEGNYIIIF